jgi:hypothetical protein
MACTVDCLSQYGCLPYRIPKQEAIYAPFIELRIGDFGVVTVGNKSSPNFDNQACITSFSYGFSGNRTDFGAEFEVIDQGGACHRRLIRAMTKTIAQATSDAEKISFDFGWILQNCDNTIRKESFETIYGKRLYGNITQLNTSIVKGNIKLQFTVSGPHALEVNVKHEHVLGDDDDKMTLRQAITRLCTEAIPKYKSVRFVNKDGKELEFETNGKEGPRSAWPSNQKDKLSTIRTWLSTIRSKDGRGLFLIYDPTTISLIVQEDKIDRSNPANCSCENNIGTFLVNGGDCGNVLEFNPSFNFIPNNVTSGGSSGSSTSGGYKKAEPSNKVEEVGAQTSVAIQQYDLTHIIPEDMANRIMDAMSAHLESNTPYESLKEQIEAELKIIGEPEFGLLFDKNGIIGGGTFCSIIFINPFHLGRSCTWMTTSNCNSILSNKQWLIKGVNHQIQSGSFVTTLKVVLSAPNSQIAATDALGGCGNEVFDDDLGKSVATPKQGPQ